MLASAELRWFFPGQVPADVAKWFRCGELWARQPERTDEYLLLPGCETAGVKLREGRFEVKARTVAPHAVEVAPRVRGYRDAWVKWSRAVEDAALARSFLRAGDERWLGVRKQRVLRGFSLDGPQGAGAPREVSAGAVRPARGCGVEITEVTVAGLDPPRWWTLGLEAFDASGASGDPGPCLDAVALAFFAAAPPPVELELDASRSYASWLLQVAGSPTR
jgi:hypothetical protein